MQTFPIQREGAELVPKVVQPYFEITQQTADGDNCIEGTLSCCSAHDFEVLAVGEIKRCLFSKMSLYPKNDKTVLEVRCKRCGKVISVFNSDTDGYGQYGKKPKNTCVSPRLLDCVKCQSDSFSVSVKYEYPDAGELRELGISDADNAFTWIWITPKCNNCKTVYRNIFDCETT